MGADLEIRAPPQRWRKAVRAVAKSPDWRAISPTPFQRKADAAGRAAKKSAWSSKSRMLFSILWRERVSSLRRIRAPTLGTVATG
jgi:hypothetical protein